MSSNKKKTWKWRWCCIASNSFIISDLLKKSAPSRIVVVGSCGQWFGNINPENPLDFKRYQFPLLNYCSTKVLNMLFTVELARRLEVERNYGCSWPLTWSAPTDFIYSFIYSFSLWRQIMLVLAWNADANRRFAAITRFPINFRPNVHS